LEIDPEIKAIIITGGEYVFSAVWISKEMASLPNEECDEFIKSMMRY